MWVLLNPLGYRLSSEWDGANNFRQDEAGKRSWKVGLSKGSLRRESG